MYQIQNKIFDTYKKMKTYAYFNVGVGKEDEALELYEDEILKIYKLIRTERRLMAIKTYDKEEEDLKEWNKRQLTLW